MEFISESIFGKYSEMNEINVLKRFNFDAFPGLTPSKLKKTYLKN